MSSLTSDEWSAFQWTFCAASTVTTVGRLCIRYHQFRFLQADDIFNILALLTLIGVSAVGEASDRVTQDDVGFDLRLQLAMDMLLWATLYLVKASFLALIWHVFNVSAGFRKAWWIVTIYTFVTFWIIFLSELWQCGDPSTYDDPQACDYAYFIQTQGPITITRFVLHISSDLFIIVLPLIPIRKLNMPMSRKIGVAAIFMIIIIDTAISITRNVGVVLAAYGSPTDTSGSVDLVCQVVEPALAVLVCSLPAYKTLVLKFRSRRSSSYERPRTTGGKWWRPKKSQLTDSIPDTLLEFSTLREQPTQTTERGSEETPAEASGVAHVVEENV